MKYIVSPYGEVWYIHHGRFMVKSLRGSGYYCVGRNMPIHRLVAEKYIPNPEKKPQVNHIDGNKLNNHIDNLEWATRSENALHSYDAGLQQRKFSKKHLDIILHLHILGYSYRKIGRIFNSDHSVIRKNILRLKHRLGGK